MSDNILANQFKFVAGQTSPEDALSAGDYPASGSYIDIKGADRVHVVIHLGAIHASDVPVFKLQQTDAANGTLATIDATNCEHTCAADDDDEMITFTLDPSQLTDGNEFVSVDVSGVTNGSYADILFMLEMNKRPVTQTTALLPTASQHVKA